MTNDYTSAAYSWAGGTKCRCLQCYMCSLLCTECVDRVLVPRQHVTSALACRGHQGADHAVGTLLLVGGDGVHRLQGTQ